MGSGGRPSKHSPDERAAAVREWIDDGRHGAKLKEIGARLGVSPETVRSWAYPRTANVQPKARPDLPAEPVGGKGGSLTPAARPRLTLGLANLLEHALTCDVPCERCRRAHDLLKEDGQSWRQLFEHVRHYDAARERIVAAARAFVSTVPRVKAQQPGARDEQVNALSELQAALDGQAEASIGVVVDDLRDLVVEVLGAVNMARRKPTQENTLDVEAWMKRLAERVGLALEEARAEVLEENASTIEALRAQVAHHQRNSEDVAMLLYEEKYGDARVQAAQELEWLRKKVKDLEERLKQGGEVESRRAHNPEDAGSNPAPATRGVALWRDRTTPSTGEDPLAQGGTAASGELPEHTGASTIDDDESEALRREVAELQEDLVDAYREHRRLRRLLGRAA